MRSWLMLVMIALVGCERGCLSKRLASTTDAALPFDLVDCPDGLARCIDGRLERSVLGAVGKGASCPWAAMGECPGDCVEGVVVTAPHASQLCRVEAGVALTRRSAAGADGCHEARFECGASQVIDCDAKQVVAVCTQGCAMDALDEDLPEEDAVTILCRH